MITSHAVLFHSDGVALAGCFYRNQPFEVTLPTVIVTGSWLTVKEQMPATYATALAERGLNVFIFDFSGFGQSEGQPRQAEIPARKIRDIFAAVEFLKTVAFVDGTKIGLLTICASAQYALRAIADGLDVKSFVAVAGWFHDPATIAASYGGKDRALSKLRQSDAAALRYFEKGEVITAPAYDPENPEAGMPMRLDYYSDPKRGAIPAWKNEMAVISWFYWLNYEGLDAAPRVKIPTLMVHSDDCALPKNARKVHDRLGGEKKLLWSKGSQIDFYDQLEQVTLAADAATKHFQHTL